LRIDDTLSLGIDSISDFGHETQPNISCLDLTHFSKATLELFALKFSWITIVRLKDKRIKAVAIFRLVLNNLNRIEKLFTTLLNQLVRILSELFHEVRSLLSTRAGDASRRITNAI